ncbi:MAG: 1-acyl-sn-glycerol-3-phosphate acyltransferase [Phaeodactylibacter sp.]|nr:1-acyl-sn-glycerol-3-phosphate acyltransferase [Phaeodactylibacter sp.]MCB9272967.1 1-acyl-sn-glycerol-3-phosphate acyltransferase [Lewinellaceae bacterium]
MNPILRLIYQSLKLLVRACFRLYYRRTIINRSGLHFNRPAILVSNHPNTLMDPLNAAEQVPMIVHFLANAGLFKSRLGNWFFNTFFCIPIERPEDTEGKPLNNRESFARCDAFLGQGGCLYIAPEGYSFVERRLRPLKTGTARIALSAENAKAFELGLCIVPVGLSYEAPQRFGSRVLINVGEPIWAKDYREAYESGSFMAPKMLTADLAERLRALIIDTRDDAEGLLVSRLEQLLRNSRPVPEALHFSRTKALIERLREWHSDRPEQYQAFAEEVAKYFEQLHALRTSDAALARPPRPLALHLAGLVLFFPLYLYGLTNNFLPAYIPLLLTRKLKLYTGYDSTVKILSGLITFPLFYFLQTRLVYGLYDGHTALLYLISLLPAGLFAWHFRRHQGRVLDYLRLRRHKKQAAALRELREEAWSAGLADEHDSTSDPY